MNNAGDNPQTHAAATGRFATAEEIIQNFYCEPHCNDTLPYINHHRLSKLSIINNNHNKFKIEPNVQALNSFLSKIKSKKNGFRNILLYAFLAFVLILLLMPFQQINSINLPFFIFKDFIVILILFFFLIYRRNKYKIRNQAEHCFMNDFTPETGTDAGANVNIAHNTDINYFRLGILDAISNYNNYNKYDNYHNHVNAHNENRLIVGIDKKKRFEHIMIVSPTGGGKTSKYIIPSIRKDACFQNICVYAIDIDGPYLYNAVKDSWLANNKKIVHFDPYSPESVHFNPLIERCAYENYFNENNKTNVSEYYKIKNKKNYKIIPANDDKLYELSSMIFFADNNELKGGDIQAHKYYSKRSTDILYGCLLYLKGKYDIKYFNLITAKKFFEKGFGFIEKEIKSYDGNNRKKIKEIFNNFFEIPSYERAKIITDILNGLDFIKNANVENSFKTSEKVLTDENFFTIKDLFDKNNDMLLIVSVPKEKINSGGSRLISIITDMVIKEIYENRRVILKNNSEVKNTNNNANNNTENNTNNNYEDFLYKDIFIYLDEFPVLNINNFDIELANLRKTGTGVCISLQDISFLKNKYGDVSLIDSNIGTHIIMGNAGIDTAKRYSERIGQKYVMHSEKFRAFSKGRAFAEIGLNNKRETPVASGLFPLMNADEIKNMDINDVLIYSKFTRPFILSLR